MKYLDLFAGYGGFSLGIQQAYENNRINRKQKSNVKSVSPKGYKSNSKGSSRDERKQNLNCVGFSEIDKYAIQVYQKHFPNHKNYGDITKIDERLLPDFDLLVGGFPCQSFSIAGKRGGFSDTRGTLFFEIARIIKQKQPRLLLLENVKGLLSHDEGNTFFTIIKTLNELGYDCQWQVLNAKNFGVPQNRERVFIVGHLRGTPRPEVFPFQESPEISAGKNGQRDEVAYCLQAGGDKHRGSYIRQLNIPEATKKGYAEAEVGDSINLSVPNSTTPRGRVGNKIAQTLDTGMQQHTLTENAQIRRLTPLECERLMGLPDKWTMEGTEGKISDTQRYKLCGNGVVVNVVEEIITTLL